MAPDECLRRSCLPPAAGLQEQYLKEAQALWSQSLQGTPRKRPPLQRRRLGFEPVAAFFSGRLPAQRPHADGLADAVEGDEKTRARIRFGVEQWMAAAGPEQLPGLQRRGAEKAIETKGESVARACKTCCTTFARAMCR